MKFRRRRYIINAGLQMKFTLSFVLVSLLGSIVAVTAFNFLALRKLETLMWSTHISVKTTGELIKPLFISVNIINFLFVSILLIITGIWMIRKVSGPLHGMSKDIMRVANGDLSISITLRQKDVFKDTAYELNIMVKSIRERFEIISEKYRDISKSIGEFKEKASNTEASIKDYNSILKNIESLETEMNSFKLRQKQ
jgi:methyl-accepting chemotaxis protein